jgi:hypothetical protein
MNPFKGRPGLSELAGFSGGPIVDRPTLNSLSGTPARPSREVREAWQRAEEEYRRVNPNGDPARARRR